MNKQSQDIEIKIIQDDVCIYATPIGLMKIIKFCETLLANPKIGHIHMEDYNVLTENSRKTVIVMVTKET